MRDRTSGRRVLRRFDGNAAFLEIRKLSQAGKLEGLQVFSENSLIEETFTGVHTRRTIQRAGRGIWKIDFLTIGLSATNQRPSSFMNSRTGLRACLPGSPDNVKSLLDHLSWLSDNFTDERRPERNGNSVYIGNNIELIGCDVFPESIEKLASHIRQGLAVGLGCLAKLGEVARSDAATLLGFLQPGYGRHLKFFCTKEVSAKAYVKDPTHSVIRGDLGIASEFDDPDRFPGLMLNQSYSAPLNTLPSTIFHELIHNLGYIHGNGLDIAFLAESCCFPEDLSPNLKTLACDIVRRTPPLEWTGAAYQAALAQILGARLQDDVALDSVWRAAAQSPRLAGSGLRDGSALLAGIENSTGADKSPLLSAILATAALKGLPEASLPRVGKMIESRWLKPASPTPLTPTPDRRPLIDWLASIASAALNQDDSRLVELWKKRDEMKQTAIIPCSQSEKNQINDLDSFISNLYRDRRPVRLEELFK